MAQMWSIGGNEEVASSSGVLLLFCHLFVTLSTPYSNQTPATGSRRVQARGLSVCGGLGQEGLGVPHSKENHPVQYSEERLRKP